MTAVTDRHRAGVVSVRPLDPDDVSAALRLLRRVALDEADHQQLAAALGLDQARAPRPPRTGRSAGYARTTAGKARP